MRRQITVAYLKFAAASTLFFAIIAAVAVEGIEVRPVRAMRASCPWRCRPA